MPAPLLDTVMWKPIWWPDVTGPSLSAVLAMAIWAQFTVIDTEPIRWASEAELLAPAVASRLVSVLQVAAVVGDVTCTLNEVLGASDAALQLSVPVITPQEGLGGGLPEVVGLPVAMLQLTPVAAGSWSDSTTFVAVAGPPLATVTVNPMVSPALTLAASAVLVTVSDGHCTVMDVLRTSTVDALVAIALASALVTVPQVAPVVWEVTWTA